jgi:guanylate kinase
LKKSESKSKISNKSEAATPGALIIISAPSGAGKTTLVDRLLKRHPEWVRSISVTTRAARSGEAEGDHYHFVTREVFKQMETKGELLESAKVFDQFYGTPKKFVMDHLIKGKNVVLAIDVQGTKKIKKLLGEEAPLCTIFILPPSVKVLRERLEGRKTESPEQVQHRIEMAQDEIKEAGSYDFTVVNQNLEQTVVEVESFIDKYIKERRKSHVLRLS